MNIETLKNLMERGEVSQVSSILDSVRDTDSSTKSKLFEVFDDTIEDDFLFSALHVLESIENETYVKAYLVHLQGVLTRSPRWAGIMLIRIVNNSSCYEVLKPLLKNLVTLDLVQKAREQAVKIKKDMPLFE